MTPNPWLPLSLWRAAYHLAFVLLSHLALRLPHADGTSPRERVR